MTDFKNNRDKLKYSGDYGTLYLRKKYRKGPRFEIEHIHENDKSMSYNNAINNLAINTDFTTHNMALGNPGTKKSAHEQAKAILKSMSEPAEERIKKMRLKERDKPELIKEMQPILDESEYDQSVVEFDSLRDKNKNIIVDEQDIFNYYIHEHSTATSDILSSGMINYINDPDQVQGIQKNSDDSFKAHTLEYHIEKAAEEYGSNIKIDKNSPTEEIAIKDQLMSGKIKHEFGESGAEQIRVMMMDLQDGFDHILTNTEHQDANDKNAAKLLKAIIPYSSSKGKNGLLENNKTLSTIMSRIC